MTTVEQAAQEMRREVKGLCNQCGEPLPWDVLEHRQAWLRDANKPREASCLCDSCYRAWKRLQP